MSINNLMSAPNFNMVVGDITCNDITASSLDISGNITINTLNSTTINSSGNVDISGNITSYGSVTSKSNQLDDGLVTGNASIHGALSLFGTPSGTPVPTPGTYYGIQTIPNTLIFSIEGTDGTTAFNFVDGSNTSVLNINGDGILTSSAGSILDDAEGNTRIAANITANTEEGPSFLTLLPPIQINQTADLLIPYSTILNGSFVFTGSASVNAVFDTGTNIYSFLALSIVQNPIPIGTTFKCYMYNGGSGSINIVTNTGLAIIDPSSAGLLANSFRVAFFSVSGVNTFNIVL